MRRRPSTVARSTPGLIRDGSARPPKSRPSPETTMVLPAPVSPVTTLKPGDSSSTASSMTPRPLILTSSSIARRLLVSLPCRTIPPRSVPRLAFTAPAGDRQAELRHQPVGEGRPDDHAVAVRACLAVRVVPQSGEQDGHFAPPDLDPRARRQVDLAAAVAPQDGARR